MVTRPTHRWFRSWITLAALGVFALGASAGTAWGRARPREQAEAEARKACAAGRVGEGIEMLAALLTEYGHPNYIYNQARCYQQNGKPEQAISRFKEYLRAAQDVTPDERARVERFIRELEAEVQAAAPPAPVHAPAPVPAPVAPASNAAVPTPAEAARASEAAGEAPAPVTVARSARPEPPTGPRHLRTAGIALGVIGVAGLAGGLVAGLQVRSLEQEVQSAKKLTSQQWSDHEKKGQRYETLQWVGYGVGGAALAGAIVCLIVDAGDRGSAERARAVRLIGTVGPTGRPGLALAGRF
jgi:hypothetical protein